MRLAVGLEKGWKAKVDGKTYDADLPATLDLLGIGEPNPAIDMKKLSRKRIFTGKALFSREFYSEKSWEGKSAILFLERARVTRVWLNGIEALSKDSLMLSTPHSYELDGILQGPNLIEVETDNNYSGHAMPAGSILYGHAATEETQTNWNGLIGLVELRMLPKIRIESLRAQAGQNREAEVSVAITNKTDQPYEGILELSSEGFAKKCVNVSVPAGGCLMLATSLAPEAEPALWSEFEPNLHAIKASIGEDCLEESFGLRTLSANPALCVNGKRTFLRSEANCAVFPLTGHTPMDEKSWTKLFATYKAYGANAVRFHSWCPPEAAFRAADLLGLYLQPELSCWNCESMFGSLVERQYYTAEAEAILEAYGGHPSFVMLSLGNELRFSEEKLDGEDGLEYADRLLKELKEKDPSKLYTFASNGCYGWQPPTERSDCYHAQAFKDLPLRGAFSGNTGQIYEKPPETVFNYSLAVEELGVPAVSFEVGQYQVFPDVLEEPAKYTGPLEPRNFHQTLESLREKEFSDYETRQMTADSGELSLLGYRQEIEAALRTPGLSGISLLGLQDFPGQGTALVGMMNALGEPKPYPFADPARFRRFFAPVATLAELSKFVWQSSEELSFAFLVANYGPADLSGEASWRLSLESGSVLAEASGFLSAPQGAVTKAQETRVSLAPVLIPSRLMLELSFREASSAYDIWVYPAAREKKRDVLETGNLGEEALARLDAGGKVLLDPSPDKMPNTVPGQFETAFWSTAFGEGTLGISVDPKSPIFKSFPTFSHSSFQWFNLTKNGRPMILDNVKDKSGKRAASLISVTDGFTTLRRLGLLFEARVGKGKLMVSSMGLGQSGTLPEVGALRESVLDYMESDEFEPGIELEVEDIKRFLE